MLLITMQKKMHEFKKLFHELGFHNSREEIIFFFTYIPGVILGSVTTKGHFNDSGTQRILKKHYNL